MGAGWSKIIMLNRKRLLDREVSINHPLPETDVCYSGFNSTLKKKVKKEDSRKKLGQNQNIIVSIFDPMFHWMSGDTKLLGVPFTNFSVKIY